jgi:CheY-like chemotaxis protein
MPGMAKFNSVILDSHVLVSLTLNCFKEDENIKEEHVEEVKNIVDVQYSHTEKPLVFIVDDEQDIRRLIKRAMKQAGWETIEAEDGQQALEYFQQEDKKSVSKRVTAIVSDVRMPRMTGPHFLVALREEKIQTPFIFFSSNLVDKGDNGFKYDNVFYLTKEAGLEELKKLVGKCMPAQTAL